MLFEKESLAKKENGGRSEGRKAGRSETESVKNMELRIMTYNIQHGEDHALRLAEHRAVIDLEKTADTVRRVGADVCVLNEVRGKGLTEEYTEQAQAIGASLGFHSVFGRSTLVGGTEPYGNAIVSRFPIESAEVIPIPDPIADGKVPQNVESRSVLRCTFSFDDGKKLTVLSSHFGLSDAERKNAVALCEKLLDSEKVPTVLLGDFNAVPTDAVLSPLFRNYQSAEDLCVCTFPTEKPSSRIDYIFLNDKIELLNSGIGKDSASDHLPVWADIRF